MDRCFFSICPQQSAQQIYVLIAGAMKTVSLNTSHATCDEAKLSIIFTESECEKAATDMNLVYAGMSEDSNGVSGCYSDHKQNGLVYFSYGDGKCNWEDVACLCKQGLYAM